MCKTFAFFLINLFCITCYAQTGKDTVFQVGGRAGDHIDGAGIDKNDNIVIAGDFSSSNLYVNDSNKGLKATLPSDLFVMKLGHYGNTIWQRSFINEGNAMIIRTSMDASGNIYLGGNFYKGLSLDNQSVSGSATVESPFIAKIDSSGKAVWFKSYKIWSGVASVDAVACDNSGNLYATCYFSDSIMAEGVTYKATAGVQGLNTFIVKYDPAGNYLWGKAGNFIFNVLPDTYGNVYINGLVGTAKILWGGADVTRNDANVGFSLAKIKGDGTMLWFKSWSAGNNTSTDLNIGSDGNIYGAGSYNDFLVLLGDTLKTVGPRPNDADIFMLSFDTSGKVLWYKTYGSVDLDYEYSSKLDNNGSFYATGNFGPSPLPIGTDTLKTKGMQDVFIIKLDKGGNLLGSNQTKAYDPFSQITPTSINFNKENHLYISGYFSDETSFGDSDLETRDYTDGFVWEVSPAFSEAGIDNLDGNEYGMQISLYPNPASNGNIILKSSNPISEVQFFDSEGKMVYSSSFATDAQNKVVNYPVSSLQSGLYFVRIISDKAIGTIKFIKN